MKFSEFAKKVEEQVKETLEGGYTVGLRQVEKNNGVRMAALAVCPAEEGEEALFSLEPFRAEMDEEGIKYAVGQILGELHSEKERSMRREAAASLMDWEKAKGRIVCQLVNKGWNRKMLEGRPYREYLDLAVVYSVCFHGEERDGYVHVKNENVKRWGITEGELYHAALKNMPGILPERCCHIREAIGELNLLAGEGEQMEPGTGAEPPLYVLTNASGVYGASALLYTEKLEGLAEKEQSDLYILPSSTHEVLLTPVGSGIPAEELLFMVKMINITEVKREERLSDNIYRYCKDTGEVMVITEGQEG